MENMETSATPKAGTMVREARLAAGVNAADLCSSLRISTAALEAVEACQYKRLPGDPYVRALLGSIARYLGMDAQKLLRVYNHESGAGAAEPSAAPYQDVSEVHVLAHRKLFIALLAVLLIALLFILAKVNSSSEKRAAQAKPPQTDTLTVAIPPPSDSMLESPSLKPDSVILASDSAAARAKADSAKAHAKAKVDSAAVAAKVAPAAPATSRETINRVILKALVDSAGFHAFHKGKWYMAETLTVGQQREISRRDTINIILLKAKSMEITFADTTVVPTKRRFKIIGKNILYY